jgi:hypothetical protein
MNDRQIYGERQREDRNEDISKQIESTLQWSRVGKTHKAKRQNGHGEQEEEDIVGTLG